MVPKMMVPTMMVKMNRINRFLNSPVAGAQIEPELTEQPSTSEYTGDIIPLGANSCTC